MSSSELGLLDPSGQLITVTEARRFSPPAASPAHVTLLAYIEKLGLPTADPERPSAVWDSLGLTAFDNTTNRSRSWWSPAGSSRSGCMQRICAPVLTISDPAMAERFAPLRERGHPLDDRLPHRFDTPDNALRQAPDGTLLLLHDHRGLNAASRSDVRCRPLRCAPQGHDAVCVCRYHVAASDRTL